MTRKRHRRYLPVPTVLALLAVLFGTQPAQSSVPRPIAPVPDFEFHQIMPVERPAVLVIETRTSRPPPPTPHPDPASSPIAVVIAPRTPGSTVQVSVRRLRGVASWYCLPGRSICTKGYAASGAYAAAGPRLRDAIGPAWRGRIVWVNGVAVRLIDWCQCYRGEPNEKLLDLYHSVFIKTGSRVTITW